MSNKIKELIEEFEKEYNSKVLYVTIYGSKLFGTDTKDSDTDYKGVFIPNINDVLLKRDLEHFSYNTNTKNKNEKDDVDMQLYSIYKWFNLLKKGETGALDMLFSFFREDTQIFCNKEFAKIVKDNYSKFYNRNLHSFIGYCVGQSKIYNIKGERYKELLEFIEEFKKIALTDANAKLESYFQYIEQIFANRSFKYVKFVKASISRGNQAYKEGRYVEILGKRFSGMVTVGYFSNQITQIQEQYGNRVKNSKNGVDFKALSHAVRVLNEVEELLDSSKITFPLPNREYIKSIKEGKESLESVMEYIDKKLDEVQKKLENSTLPQKSDEEFIDDLILKLLNSKYE